MPRGESAGRGTTSVRMGEWWDRTEGMESDTWPLTVGQWSSPHGAGHATNALAATLR